MKKTIYVVLFLPFISFIIGYSASYFLFQTSLLVVPSIIGKPLQEATELLAKNQLGLRLRVRREDETLPEGIVLDQVPQAGQKIRPNQNVFITLSSRPKPLKMIDGWAKRRKDIVDMIHDKGLEVSWVYLKSHYPDDLCIAQYPLPETELVSKKVMFYFSDGRETMYVVPDFRHYSVQQAEQAIEHDTIEVEIFHREQVDENHECSNCMIIAQYPLPGEIVDLNQQLHIQFQVALS